MNKIIVYSFYCLLPATLALSSFLNAQFGPMPAMPPMNGQPQAPGGMPMPSEQELEQILQMIEKAAAENPELIKEWERQGQREILKMSDADLAAFSQMVGIAPGVLREEAEKALADELAATPTQQPVDEDLPTQRPVAQQKPTQPTAPKITKAETQQAGTLIKSLIKQLSEIQIKSASVREVHELMRAWIQELRELMFYLSVIDRHEYHQHLSLPQFKSLLSALTTLQNSLKTELSAVVLPDDLTEEGTLYDLLGVKKSASTAVLDAAYERLAAQHNPKKLEQKLREQQVPEKSIKQQVKKATLSFDAIEDAYEQLSNPKLRAQIDREIQARKSLKQEKIAHATQALKSIKQSLEEAIYLEELLYKLEQFLQDYAPAQLALKKSIEEAEKKQLEEQKKRGSITPTSTYGTFEPHVSYSQPSGYDDYGYNSNFNPYSDYGSYNNYPDYSYGSDMDDDYDLSSPSNSASRNQAEQTDQEDAQKEQATPPSGKSYQGPSVKDVQESQKIDPRTIDEITKALDKNFDELVKNYEGEMRPGTTTRQESPYKKIIDELPTKARKKQPAPLTPSRAQDQAEEIDEETAEEPSTEVTTAPTQTTTPPSTTPVATPRSGASTPRGTPTEPAREIPLLGIDISQDFEKIRTGLKINTIAADAQKLLDKIALTQTNAKQDKELSTLARKMRKHKNIVPNLLEKMQSIMPDVELGNNKNNTKALNALVNDLTTANDSLEELRDMYPTRSSASEE